MSSNLPSLNALQFLFGMQNSMQKIVDPDWINKGWNFTRAVMVEGVEALEHHGWKWWKKQTRDDAQLQLEQVDIVHFISSHMIVEYEGNYEKAASHMYDLIIALRGVPKSYAFVVFDNHTYYLLEMELVELLDLQVGLAAARRYSVPLFQVICDKIGLSWEELIFQYVCKNSLNIFRQRNGYKDGTYVKMWDGAEDNSYLSSYMSSNRSSFSMDGVEQFVYDLDLFLQSTYVKITK